jgi:hypothetical protein
MSVCRTTLVAGFLVLSVGLPSTASAQMPPGGLRHLGFEAGVGQSTLSGGSGVSALTSLMAGFYLTPGPDTLTWQVEGLVHWKGARVGDSNIRLLDFEVPVLVRFNLSPATRTGWYIVAGPAIAYRAKASLAGEGGSLDLTEFSPTLEYGVIGGVGVGGRRFGVAVRLQQGLNGTNVLLGNSESRTRSVTALVTFRVE